MKDQRPVNLKLTSIHFPVTAITSIMHRLSGLFLFVLIPFVLWAFSYAFSSQQHFNVWAGYLSGCWGSILLWLVLVAVAYHFVAGIRHLLMDHGLGESLKGGRIGSILTLLIWIALAITAGVLICLGIL